MHERWTTVPTDFDDARRFATEYEIEVEHAVEAQLLGPPSGEASSPAVEKLRRAQHRLNGPRARATARIDADGMAVLVSLKTQRLEWTLELRGGEPYELPASLVERFAADHRRLCGMED